MTRMRPETILLHIPAAFSLKPKSHGEMKTQIPKMRVIQFMQSPPFYSVYYSTLERNAKTPRMGRLLFERTPTSPFDFAGLVCDSSIKSKVLAATYCPTPLRGQYHRR